MARSERAKPHPKPKASSGANAPAGAPKTRSLPAVKEESQLEIKGSDLPEVKTQGLPEVRAVDQPGAKSEKPSKTLPDKSSAKAQAPRQEDAASPGGQASDKIKIKGAMTLAGAAAQFEKIVAGLASGEAVISAGKEFISLRPALDVTIEIKAARKKDEEKVSLKMAWKHGTL
jgi:amphi-Trp domain-containing protein